MTLEAYSTASLRTALDSQPAERTPSRSPPPLRPLTFSDPAPPSSSIRPKPRAGPPRLQLGALSATSPLVASFDRQLSPPPLSAGVRPALTIQPASPAMSSSATFASPTSPFPPPIPSTSTSPSAPSFQRPPSPSPGGGLAARRAAKLGKKRLSLVVPTASSSSGAGGALLSPASPSYLHPGGADDAETRSLPPSPVSLTTFIGTEGSEAPDRTIGRLMLKQQADEMREQMRGGRGMRRRTSIPRLNLVGGPIGGGGGGAAVPSGLDLAPGRDTTGPSAVQLIRGSSFERRGAGGSDVEDDGVPVEEFPYALGPREILPGVFLGSEQNAKDAAVLRQWRIGFVLNVAKEVDCPWLDESIEEESEEWTEESEETTTDEGVRTPPLDGEEAVIPLEPPSVSTTPRALVNGSASRHPHPTHPPPARPKHRRTKTQAAAVPAPPPAPESTPPVPVRPPFIRPTASTPNLHAAYSPISPPPPVPAIPSVYLPGTSPSDSTVPAEAAMQRSLSSSPPVPRRSPPRPLRRAPAPIAAAAMNSTSSTRSAGAVRIPPNSRTGRPPLEYLWLKWGHDESDLVEAKKFQAAFDFLDEARERGERILVHCQCGVSRSATVVIAYCMREAAKALEEGRDAAELAGCTGMHDTYSFVKEKSEWVGPNLSLVFQLVAYERTLRGDSLNDELGGEGENGDPAYPNYPPEPPSPPLPSVVAPHLPLTNGFAHHGLSAGDDDDEPPRSAVFGTFTFPPPLQIQPPSAGSAAHHLPPLRSPRTPISSEGSGAGSQLSTPDLHDPLISPTFSTGTKASSVTSTPLSNASERGESLPRPPVRVIEADEGLRGRHSSMDTVVGAEDEQSVGEVGEAGKPVFVLPVPPTRHSNPSTHSLHLNGGDPNPISPTVAAFQQRPLRPLAPTLSLSVPVAPSMVVSATSITVSTAPTSSTLSAAVSPATASVISPDTAFSPASASTISAPSPHPSMVSSVSSTSLASVSSSSSATATISPSTTGAAPSSNGGLSRSSSTRRFGASQTPSQRRASHRRLFSDADKAILGGMTPAQAGAAGAAREAEGEREEPVQA
ncbi:hypothetical protein JCM8097_005155 [Rhodosporidiobolus ruineniae]